MKLPAYDAVIASPIGKLGLRTHEDYITDLAWLSTNQKLISPTTSFAELICNSITLYFESAIRLPCFPLQAQGTPFQRKVWTAMQKIPAGQVQSYGQLAARLKTGSRAIGMACRTNPIIILIPCHRVVSAQGIGGFMGKASRTNIKQWLLHHEGMHDY